MTHADNYGETSKVPRLMLGLLALLLGLTCARQADAFPWMIRHEYTGCAQCHFDPSGGTLLTAYGRAQTQLLLSTQWTRGQQDEEPARFDQFLFGAFALPDAVLAQGWVRNGYLWNTSDGTLVDRRFLQMRADLEVGVSAGALRAAASLGYGDIQSAPLSQQAWLTSASSFGNLVSREHWIGVSLAEGAVLLRGGRMLLPFGLRNIEHTSFVRAATRTDVNQGQQHGISASVSTEHLRAEIMAVLGNYQIHPDAFRDRGYMAFAEYAFASRYAVGVSSSVLHAQRDLQTATETWRQAHGAFARVAPVDLVAVLAEMDALVSSPAGVHARTGYAGFLQVDVEPLRGVHVLGTGEVLRNGTPGENPTIGLWLSAVWFPYSHFELRADAVRRTSVGAPVFMTYVLQGQVYL